MWVSPLDGAWRLRREPLSCTGEVGMAQVREKVATHEEWIEAQVPGEVHLDLMRAGEMPEPLYGLNTSQCRWPEQFSWWYRRVFTVSEEDLAADRIDLVFEGIDLAAQVYLNGQLLGESANAFVEARFDARPHLVAGENEVIVRVTVGTELGEGKPDHYEVSGTPPRHEPRRIWLRKPQFSYGWDWVDSLPNIGIWRSVSLQGWRGARLADVHARTSLCYDEQQKTWPKAQVRTRVLVENLSATADLPLQVTFELTAPTGERFSVERRVAAQPGLSPVDLEIAVPRPQLWWPRGLGDQPLYEVSVQLRNLAGKELDSRVFTYGLRTIEVDRTPLNESEELFAVCVNGERVFCRGANWIPADAILARARAEKYEALVQHAADANFNMLRVWGGGIYEHDAFYAACDRLGILVWQDFMFSCAQYPDDDDEYCAEVRREAELAVRRLRHHACLALWCGNNENNWGFDSWWPGKPAYGQRLYGQILPAVCAQLDPDRFYWPSSPCGGPDPNSELAGDCHWWGNATMNPDMKRRIDPTVYDECRAKFVSEYGVIGPPVLASLRQYLPPEALHREHPAWQVHNNTFEKHTVVEGIRFHYVDPEHLTLEDYLLYAQLFQGVMYGYSLESMRFRKPVCNGALFWMYSDCWGEVGWTIVDYYLRRKPSYYYVRRAFAPLKVVSRRVGEEIVVRLLNDTSQEVHGRLQAGFVRLDGKGTRQESLPVHVAPGDAVTLHTEKIPAQGFDTHEWVYAATVTADSSGLCDTSILNLHPWRQMHLAPPQIIVEERDDHIELESPVFCHAVHAVDDGLAVWSDNYFDLLPHTKVRLQRGVDAKGRKADFQAVHLR